MLDPEGTTHPEHPDATQPKLTEGAVTKSIERYTGAIPSTAYLGVAIAAMGLSLAAQVGGKGKWGNFIAQWVPTWLLIGLYNKIVKTQGHDRLDQGERQGLRHSAFERSGSQ